MLVSVPIDNVTSWNQDCETFMIVDLNHDILTG